ncbi:hypothetical protein B9Z65_4636 [Elsinoe australis]|uniref:Cellobiose dehydrogenase-like cytochrome domain-containing protein n=1 Tax=Elsinoe australis TaxID=40998 RepID=A0A2P8A5M5_9PEZI|nr:hypothetical protein B9Z65_4636 [Elsinoe australis]
MVRYGFLSAALAAGAAAQAVKTVDSNTGITFAAFKDETTGTQVGLALPESYTGDFIGQLVAPTGNSTGWVGMSLGPAMLNNLLVAAWPNEKELVSTFRQASDYAAPGPYPGANFTAEPISTGTFVNATHYSYTFLCSGCLAVQPNFQGNGTTGTGIGWALSTTELANTASANTTLNFHSAGQGIFSLSFADAQSAQFDEWAQLAKEGATPTNPDAEEGGDDEGDDEGSDEEGGSAGPTEAPFPTSNLPGPTATSTANPTLTGVEATTTATPTGTGRPRRTRTRSSRRSRPTSSSKARAKAAPFRPAFNPDAVNGNDFEDAQKFKASFLDGYYKGSE